MRSLSVLALVLGLAALPGCVGGGNNAQGPNTVGDRGQSDWQIFDGLCGGGLLGNDCDLGQAIAVGATPLVQVRAHGGANLDHAMLAGDANIMLSGFSSSTDDHGILLSAHVGSDVAGVHDVMVVDEMGQEIDRVHFTFATATTLTCGELSMGVTRDLRFAGLTSGTRVDITTPAGATQASTPLACRADDASGHALLTVNAIRWSVATGATGMVQVRSDDFLGSTPAVGATSRVLTTGTGRATIHTMLGTVSTDVMLSFH